MSRTIFGPSSVPLLTVARAAELLDVDPRTIERWADAGKLASVHLPDGSRRIPEADVRRLKTERATATAPPVVRGPAPDELTPDDTDVHAAATLSVEYAATSDTSPTALIAGAATAAARRRALAGVEAAERAALAASRAANAATLRAEIAANRVREAAQHAARIERDLHPDNTADDQARAARTKATAQAAASALEEDIAVDAERMAEIAELTRKQVAATLADIDMVIEGEVAATSARLNSVLVGVFTAPVSRGVAESPDDVVGDAGRAFAELVTAYVAHGDELGATAVSVANHKAFERVFVDDAIKAESLAMLVHELRSPLTSIMGRAELLHDGSVGNLNSAQSEQVTNIERSAGRLAALIDDVMTLATLDQVAVPRARANLDLRDVVAAVQSELRPAIAKRRLEVTFQLPPTPVPIAGNTQELERLVANLMTNALKYTEDGGWVRCTLRIQDGAARLEVSDNGIGIPEAEQAHLFSRFFRASTARKAGIPGFGLGLAIIRSIAHNHDGTVSVVSKPAPGTTFVVTLPLRS